jgi:recombination protein RecT
MSNQLTCIAPNFYTPIKNMFVSLSDEKKFNNEVAFAIQILKKHQYLQEMDANSVLEAVLNVSQTGLTLNPVLNYSYLVPHKGKCVLYPGYQGLIKLATDTGSVTSIEVNLIYEGDDIILDLASEKKVNNHVPYILTGREKGKILGGYSLANLPDGSKHVEIMSSKDIEDVRACSESYKNDVSKNTRYSPWNTYEPEMYRKTVLKRHFK